MAKPQKYIFCYLDILGYKTIVNEHSGNEEIIKTFSEILKGTVTGVLEGFKRPLDNTETSKFVESVFDKIKTTLISDTILIRLPIIEINEENEKDAINSVGIFLHYVSFLILTFIRKTGYFLRGGISIEQHYEENENNNSLFIFSKALIKAYELEQKASSIRILIDLEIIDYIGLNDEVKRESARSNFYEDIDGNLCLDFYDALTKNMYEDFFTILMDNIQGQISHNKKDQNILYKYLGFIRYHNYYIGNNEKLKNYIIDLNIIFNQ